MPEPAPLTGGQYLALRRNAACLTRRDVGLLYAGSALSAPSVELMIGEAEADRHPLGDATIRRLSACFPIDAEIYLDLVGGVPTRSVCRSCGCSWFDPCGDRQTGGGCSWTNQSETLCSVCAAATPAEAA